MKYNSFFCVCLRYFVFIGKIGVVLLLVSFNDIEKDYKNRIKTLSEFASQEPEKALHYSYSLLSQLPQDSLKLRVTTLLLLGDCYNKIGTFRIAFEYYHQAYKDYSIIDSLLYSQVCCKLGQSLCKLKQYDQAKGILTEAMDIATIKKDSQQIATCHNAFGLLYMIDGPRELSRKHFADALFINRLLNNRPGMAQNLNNLAILRGDNEERIQFLEEAIVINKELNLIWGLAENYNNLGNIYIAKKMYDKARANLDIAMNYAQQYGARELISDNYSYYEKFYLAQNNLTKAYECLSKRYRLEKEIYATKNIKELQFSSSKQDNKQVLIAENEQKYHNDNYTLHVAYLSFIFFLFIIGYYFVTQNKKKQLWFHNQNDELKIRLNNLESQSQEYKYNLKQEQRTLNSQLSKYCYQLIHQDTILRDLRNQVKEIAKMNINQYDLELKKMSLFINNNLISIDEQKELNDYLKCLNQDFLNRLLEVHPELTMYEQDLLSMIYQNLSSREISTILQIEPKSINVARYRLRRKLNLATTDSLEGYLIHI